MSADIVVVIILFLTALGVLHLLHKAAMWSFRNTLDRLDKRLTRVQQDSKASSVGIERQQEKMIINMNEKIEALSSRLEVLEREQKVVLQALTNVQQDHKTFQHDRAKIMIEFVDQRRIMQQHMARLKEARLKRKDNPGKTKSGKGGGGKGKEDACR
ncbi:hypothetical protein Pmar_PMAR017077 [Perkinsus marinus ATCC 50983]|uniref:Uncharacterized protein n=1 Tax=Perkinsus marinus (strain ATCC 50983 / TXsc) TaxID=423536 RepID=C5LSH8_PERM5|nr:hypothetical protein Pmar_PMAR017077 [Perkinsus marinus ATCC 50983]EER00219.1 hypothetical protein Pmar_PMAR017077 [Perkinsus marinus ATCC 50983]|eukprot:XP_002767501.1 hypothetical protein Pmar_PMAR017077 [Perkinsus marinus ATCC 50983]